MSQTAEPTQTQALVVGPGAIGLFLGWDLMTPPCLAFLGRSSGPLEVEIHPAGLAPVSFRPFRRGVTAAAASVLPHDESLPLAFFFCTSPESTHAAAASLMAQPEVVRRPRITWVFCGNGLLGSATRTLVETRWKPGWALARALLYVGCTRDSRAGSVHVRHAGGTLARYGLVKGAGLPSIRGRMLRWEESTDIIKEEAEKLFVNLALARLAGPRLEENGNAVLLLPRLETLAIAFEKAFPTRRLEARELLERARQTARATAQNVNSVSLAWANGNRGPLSSLLGDLGDQPEGRAAVEAFWSPLPGLPPWKRE